MGRISLTVARSTIVELLPWSAGILWRKGIGHCRGRLRVSHCKSSDKYRIDDEYELREGEGSLS